jgi:hypothetical protein
MFEERRVAAAAHGRVNERESGEAEGTRRRVSWLARLSSGDFSSSPRLRASPLASRTASLRSAAVLPIQGRDGKVCGSVAFFLRPSKLTLSVFHSQCRRAAAATRSG